MKFIAIIVALAVASVLAENKKPEEHNEKYNPKDMQGKYSEKYDPKEQKDNKEEKYTEKYDQKEQKDNKEKYEKYDQKEQKDNKEEKYTDKYDSMDLDAIMENKRLMQAYSRCMLDQGKCTAEGKELKSHISEALQNGCAKCTNAQRHGMKRVIKYYMEKEPETWDQMVEKYDPKKTYSRKYEKELKNMKH